MAGPFPKWIRQTWGSGSDFGVTRGILDSLQLHTVCQSARCPNIGECWRRQTVTIMVLGNVCTRKCAFCSVRTTRSGQTVAPPDPQEPGRVAEAVRRLALRHAVVTSVTRDDLADGGSGHFATTIEAIRAANPGCTVEVLTPDFRGSRESVETVIAAEPDVFGHNIETVERLYPVLRDAAHDYGRSLGVLKSAAALAAATGGRTAVKSALMVGHGETPDEVRATLSDLLEAGCAAVCIGQYLRPGKTEREVAEYVTPEQFEAYERMAYAMGFFFAVAGAFVRSSYRADELVNTLKARD
ncbi:MAG TPA: lipoyl synthase [Candidatus Bathyarchaeia archaeon]|nr:lipoyl synthase [Candidatus Bathyarchaeia archaeon]